MATTNLTEFHSALESHDWFYEYSDDGRVWRAGRDNAKRLEAIANESEQHQELYAAFVAHTFHGAEKPAAPSSEPKRSPAPASSVPAFNLRNLRNLVADGAIFYVEFVKRSTGELRRMRCRLGVKSYLKGGGAAYNAAKRNLLTVFDMDASGYRSVPVDGIQRLTVGGQHFEFRPAA